MSREERKNNQIMRMIERQEKLKQRREMKTKTKADKLTTSSLSGESSDSNKRSVDPIV
jgi:hypothetical protein